MSSGTATRRLAGKVALVTGGSRGIGRAIAERLGRDGALVAVAYARDAKAAAEVVERIHAEGGRAFPLHAELGRHGDAHALWAAFDERVREHAPDTGVDIIVNNAAIGRSPDLATLTEQDFDEIFAVNVRAPFFIVQQGLARLRDGGRVINISSGAARIAMPEIIAYAATKGALDTFTRTLAKQLGPRGITVNSVAPASSTPTSTQAGCAPTRRPGSAPRRWPPSAGWAAPTTSPTSSRSSPPRTPAG